MRQLRLVWTMLWRSRGRTVLTMLSVTVAFFLFAMLTALKSNFSAGQDVAGANNIMVTHKRGLADFMPMRHAEDIRSIDGVLGVSRIVWLGLSYQDPSKQIASAAGDVQEQFKYDKRLIVSDGALEAMAANRTGMIVGETLLERHGWSIGDRVPFTGGWQREESGEGDWTFDIVGSYHHNLELVPDNLEAQQAFVRFDYVEDARQYKGIVSAISVYKDPAADMDAVTRAINAKFENSDAPVRAQSESQFQAQMSQQIGDVAVVVTPVIAAVVFTLLMVAGNAMMQAFNERVPELAVLKTLGFTDRRLAAFVVLESLLLIGAGAALGLLLASLLIPVVREGGGQMLGGFRMTGDALWLACAMAVAIALLVAAVPALQSARLRITDALRRGA